MYEVDRNVYAYECPKCGTLHYPAVARCKQCGSRYYPEQDVEPRWRKKDYEFWKKVTLAGSCRLLTYTRLWALPPGFAGLYLDLGLVEFKNGVRACGHLQVDKPKIGMKLDCRTGKLGERFGKEYYGLRFVKA